MKYDKNNIYIFLLASICLYFSTSVHAGEIPITMYKQAGCMCCDKHADILEQEGFDVEVRPLDNLDLLKADLDIPGEFRGCHTMFVGNYIVEGHVPGNFIHRLIEEEPDIRGISLPGMPTGTPGMPGERNELLDVYIIEKSKKTIFGRF